MHTCAQMKYHYAFGVKAYLSDRQKRIVAVNDGARRSVYNHFVAWNNEIYRLKSTAPFCPVDRERIDYLRSVMSSQQAIANALPYLNDPDVDSCTAGFAKRAYMAAWKNCRERGSGVPVFHRKSYEQSYQTSAHYPNDADCLSDSTGIRIIDAHHIQIPKMGTVRVDGSPAIIGAVLNHQRNTRIGTATVSRDAAGMYWIKLQIASDEPFAEQLPKTGELAGVDLNLLELVNVSDGAAFQNIRSLKQDEALLKKLQRKLSRRALIAKSQGKRLSDAKNYQKLRIRIARLQRRIAARRKDWLSCVTKRLVELYDVIAAEDLKVKNMIKNHNLAKAIADASWGTLLAMLAQKAQMYGKALYLVPPQYTTQTCSACGYVLKDNERLTLTDRDWTCPKCGTYHLRDANAGMNILNKTIKIYGL